MEQVKRYAEQLVFGLDIGTRSIVGTVGYKKGNKFRVIVQRSKEHETRAMLDGQIHEIGRVANTIREVKAQLEEAVGRELTDVCIAAAGRVLRTVTIRADWELPEEKKIEPEDIFALDSMGVEKAYEKFTQENQTEMKFYCVGYSVMHYYMNDYPISNLESHKAKKISVEMIATFLPDEVVDGLYKAVEMAGLSVVNLTLEPIAAIQVAIPEMYRMLNIALIDVGAGTSDISITKDGSIVAYGMIPVAGDSLTEIIARHCLVDFITAERIKREVGERKLVEYQDIMGLPQTISKEEVNSILEEAVTSMAKMASDKIKELNGDKPVSAVFVVGGGGKVETYTQILAEELGIPKERVALRGEEVMQNIIFEEEVKKDSLLVTPVGICLTYYENSNNFIFVTFNNERIKLYDNGKLAVVDAAMQAEFPNEDLFPKRGKAINYTVDGKARIVRGELGEAAVIIVNHEPADIHTAIKSNDVIRVVPATAGAPAQLEIRQLPEYHAVIRIIVNNQKIEIPKFASVNGTLQSGYYSIAEGDNIEMVSYYTIGQLIEFMDVVLEENMNIYVNNEKADRDTKVYENFSVIWSLEQLQLGDMLAAAMETAGATGDDDADAWEDDMEQEDTEAAVSTEGTASMEGAASIGDTTSAKDGQKDAALEDTVDIHVIVNKEPVKMTGKAEYVYVDVFDYIGFDLSNSKGRSIVTNINGEKAEYMKPLQDGDVLEIYWKEL